MKIKNLSIALRILLGLTLTAAAAMFLLNLNLIKNFGFFAVRTDIPKTTLAASETKSKGIVCPASFTALGLDASAPDLVTPIAEPKQKTSKKLYDSEIIETPLSAPENTTADFKAPAQLLTVTENEPLAATVTQAVAIETVRGTTALACTEAHNDQWIVAGSTTMGFTGLITLNNPGLVPATVNLTVHDETGEVNARAASGTLVAPMSSRTVSLAGFGAGKESVTLRVESSGSPVAATMSLTEIRDLTPMGAAQINSQKEPATEHIFSGIKNYVDHVHAEAETADEDEFPVTLRIFSPSGAGEAEIFGLSKKGELQELAATNFKQEKVQDIQLQHLPDDVNAIYVRSSTPIVTGLQTAVHANDDHDFSWYVPASIFPAKSSAPVVVQEKGQAVLVNVSDTEQTVTVNTGTPKKPQEKEETLAPWATLKIEKGKSAIVSSTGDFAVGVVLFDQKSIASYPIMKPDEALNELTVYPR